MTAVSHLCWDMCSQARIRIEIVYDIAWFESWSGFSMVYLVIPSSFPHFNWHFARQSLVFHSRQPFLHTTHCIYCAEFLVLIYLIVYSHSFPFDMCLELWNGLDKPTSINAIEFIPDNSDLAFSRNQPSVILCSIRFIQLEDVIQTVGSGYTHLWQCAYT
jgi:hypothetical protein